MFPAKYLSGLWADVVKYRVRLAVGLAFIGLLTVTCIQLKEQFPFSHFPMYGNPRPKPVDYFFLTDAAGTPLSTLDYAGISSPQIKKRLSTRLKKDDGDLLDKNQQPTAETRAAALTVLEQMRQDASARDQGKLLTWPAGVQLKMGLIHTLEGGFNETFHTVAVLPDAGPPMKGSPEAAEEEVGDSAVGFYLTLHHLLQRYSLVLVLALVIVFLRFRMPEKWSRFLLAGTQDHRNGRLEGFCIRAGLAIILWHCLQNKVSFSTLPHPAGLAVWFPEAVLWFAQPGNWELMLKFAAVFLVWYVAGWGIVVPLTALTLMHCLGRSLYASQGAPHHGQNLTALLFLAQTIAAWAQLLARGFYRLKKISSPDWIRPGNWTSHWLLMASTIAAAYVITFVTKWEKSDGKWVQNAHYFSNQIVKTHRQNYYNDLNPRYLDGVAPKPLTTPDPDNERYRHPIPSNAAFMIERPKLAKTFFSLGLLMEATAFLLILRRSWAALYGLGIISFHVMVLHLMELAFVENLMVVGIALLNLPGWLIWWSNRRNPEPTPDHPESSLTDRRTAQA